MPKLYAIILEILVFIPRNSPAHMDVHKLLPPAVTLEDLENAN